MWDFIIFLALTTLAVAGVIRRPDFTAGSLLAALMLSIILTSFVHGRGMTISVMVYIEGGLALAMAHAWTKWVSRRAQLVLGLAIVKFWWVVAMRNAAIADDGQWMVMIAGVNALLICQSLIVGGWIDGVIRWVDRLDPASSRDRDDRANRVGA